jgi:hypothetical protein
VLNDDRPGPLARFRHDDYLRYGYWHEERLVEAENGLAPVPNGHPPGGAVPDATAETLAARSPQTQPTRRRRAPKA